MTPYTLNLLDLAFTLRALSNGGVEIDLHIVEGICLYKLTMIYENNKGGFVMDKIENTNVSAEEKEQALQRIRDVLNLMREKREKVQPVNPAPTKKPMSLKEIMDLIRANAEKKQEENSETVAE